MFYNKHFKREKLSWNILLSSLVGMVLELTIKLTGILGGPHAKGEEIHFTVYQGYWSPAFQSQAVLLLENTHMKCLLQIPVSNAFLFYYTVDIINRLITLKCTNIAQEWLSTESNCKAKFFYTEKNYKNYPLKNKYSLVIVSFEEDCGFVFGNQTTFPPLLARVNDNPSLHSPSQDYQ